MSTTRKSSGERLRWLVWISALVLVTIAMAAVRQSLGAAHVVLAYLLLVLGASAQSGRRIGFALAVLAFACFNFFFVPPYHTFAVAAPLDWLVLCAFLVTSVVAAQLLARARSEAAEARQRVADVDRLAEVGAEALNAARAEDALARVADVIRTSLGVRRCEVHLSDGADNTIVLAAVSGLASAEARSDNLPGSAPGVPAVDRLVIWVAGHRRPAVVREDGTLRFGEAEALGGTPPVAAFDMTGARTILLPLTVQDRTVGVLTLAHNSVIPLDAGRQRLLGALSYYAALGAERVRLAAAAEHADALREADKLKDALLVSVSHDLRTPLTTIKALAHAIGVEGDERAVTIEEEADRLNRFVADLLDLSRLAGGALTVTPEINAAEDLLGVALQRIAGAAGDRVITVSLDSSEPLLIGRFDFTHALRVLVNLMENAVKYSPADTPIEVRAYRAGEHREFLEFSVSDCGVGVMASERERIFEPFYRPAGSPPDAGSAGLGLSIARRLAEAQGGTVYYEPGRERGSRFVLRVPAADVAELSEAVP